MTCSACGSAVPPDARFCPNCGHALVTRHDERRIATVLFADLVGFTTFSESADPEHVKNLVDTCFERLVADVDAFGGQVDKIVGDAIVALFGAPVAHENDAERAVRAALRMQETLARLRDELGIEARIRIGVNTGEVLVGALRAGGDYTAMGDVVNTASRLQTAAPPDTVLVGPATRAATRQAVRYERRGPLAVKGREEPVEAWIALEPLTLPGQRRARSKAPLIGRDAELDVLRTSIRTAVERRRAHFVLITGDAGVGKTRLTRELGTLARERHGATVVHTHCPPYGEADPWFPIALGLRTISNIETADSVDVARAKCRATVVHALGRDEDPAELDRITDGLLSLMGTLGPAPGVDPARARDDAIRALVTFLAASTDRRPLVIAIADLHWADDVVLDLVQRLLGGLRNSPFVLAATARPELEERWTPPPGPHNALALRLEPLEASAGSEMAAVLLGDDASDALVALLVERSGGNPFFIEELAAVIAESGVAAVGPGDLPMTLRGLVAARLDALDTAERATLEDCAVVGTTGTVDLVRALADREVDTEGALACLAGRDLIELDDEEYTFKNELIREVAYSTLTKADRARGHARVTDLLAGHAARTGRIEEVLDQLAFHYGAADVLVGELGSVEGIPADFRERGTGFMVRAVETAEARENHGTAVRLAAMALKMVEADGPRHTELLLARARARAGLRENAGARADLAEVAARAARFGDERLAARAATVLGDVRYKENDLVGSLATLDDAVERWTHLDDPEGLADALRQRANTYVFAGDFESAERDSHAALELFRPAGNRRGEAWGLQTLAFISFFSGDIEHTEQRLEKAGALFAELGDWGGLGWALGLLAWLRFTQGRFEEAERLGRQVLDDGVAIQDAWATGMMQVLLADIALWTGDPERAVELASIARTAFAGLADAWGELQTLVPVARGLTCLGRLDDSLDVAAEMRPVAERLSGSPAAMFAPLVHAQVLVHAGDPRAASAIEGLGHVDDTGAIGPEFATVEGLAALQAGRVDEAIGALETSRDDGRWLSPSPAAGAALALAFVAAGRATEAREICEEVAPIAVSYLDWLHQQLALAFAHHRLGRVEDARTAMHAAITRVDATGSRLDQAVVRLARAVMLEAARDPEAADARLQAAARLDKLRIPAPGWERVFTLCAGPATHA